MYVCVCIGIHVNVCYLYIVCHVYIYACVYLVRVDLYIILLVVSEGDDSAKGWRSLFENVGVSKVHELHEIFGSFWAPWSSPPNRHQDQCSRGIWLAQLLTFWMRSQTLAESNAPMDPLQVVDILGRYPKRARSGSFPMKYVFNTGPISTTYFSRQVKGFVSGSISSLRYCLTSAKSFHLIVSATRL